LVTPAIRDVLRERFGYTWRNFAHLGPVAAVVVEGQAVAVCRSVRRSALAVEAGVDTVEGFRGRGWGVAVTALWARAAAAQGLVPCYSTQDENAASLGLARSLGLVPFARDLSLFSCQDFPKPMNSV
jgi:hypothetical protein